MDSFPPPREALVARLAAIRGLVHDLSNALVGGHSLLEAIQPSLPPGDDLGEDLKLILQSILKAEACLQQMRSVYTDEAEGIDYLEPASWLPQHEQALRALLPRGVRLEWAELVPGLPVALDEVHWRDGLLVLLLNVGHLLEDQAVLSLSWLPSEGGASLVGHCRAPLVTGAALYEAIRGFATVGLACEAEVEEGEAHFVVEFTSAHSGAV